MKYFKNTELAKLYNISEKSVRNWIQAAQEGKMELQLFTTNSGKSVIANTSSNMAIIDTLVQKGKKFRNKRSHKVICPTPDFYKIYGQQQIYDMIANIDIHREIPYEYSYFDQGAKRWDEYTQKLLSSKTSNPITNTIDLLRLNHSYLESLIDGYTHVNIVDVGVGNCLPVRELVDYLLNKGLLKRYIGIDISQDMLKIAERNLKKWFNNQIPFEGYVRDINYDRFNDLLIEDSFDDGESTLNLILFFGGTVSNLREPNHAFSTIHESMGKEDLLLFSKRSDTSSSRRYFDFIAGSKASTVDFQTFRGKTVVDLLGLDTSQYDVEQYFDNKKMTRQMRLRLKVALTIEFKLGDRKKLVELNKDDTILLWRAVHQSTLDIIKQVNDNDFELLQLTKTRDKEYLMLISKLKTSDANSLA